MIDWNVETLLLAQLKFFKSIKKYEKIIKMKLFYLVSGDK